MARTKKINQEAPEEMTQKDVLDILEFNKLKEEKELLTLRVGALEEQIRIYERRDRDKKDAENLKKQNFNDEKDMIEKRCSDALGQKGKGRLGVLKIIVPNYKKDGIISEETYNHFAKEWEKK